MNQRLFKKNSNVKKYYDQIWKYNKEKVLYPKLQKVQYNIENKTKRINERNIDILSRLKQKKVKYSKLLHPGLHANVEKIEDILVTKWPLWVKVRKTLERGRLIEKIRKLLKFSNIIQNNFQNYIITYSENDHFHLSSFLNNDQKKGRGKVLIWSNFEDYQRKKLVLLKLNNNKYKKRDYDYNINNDKKTDDKDNYTHRNKYQKNYQNRGVEKGLNIQGGGKNKDYIHDHGNDELISIEKLSEQGCRERFKYSGGW
eukprot:Anaeramoba_flamelloidesc34615_g1_i1.p1 GENE.c34615_g1_i1~~c34615_g1_i1.p1  ORF type:complete len:256 (+),score=45.78 c34615_g1_i1:245-1012(+)